MKKFVKVHAFIKSISKHDVTKKAYVLKEEDLRICFTHAPDLKYLILEVVDNCGISGSCRRRELCDLRLNVIKGDGSILLISTRLFKEARRIIVADSNRISYVCLLKDSLSWCSQNVNNK